MHGLLGFPIALSSYLPWTKLTIHKNAGHIFNPLIYQYKLRRKEVEEQCPEALAEGEGFEPSVPDGTPVFETGTFGHSVTPPNCLTMAFDRRPVVAVGRRQWERVLS